MMKKMCLFCDEAVPIESNGDYDKFIGCACSPEGFYSMLKESYDHINSFSYSQKRKLFPIVSAYIRELTDCEEEVQLSLQEMDAIEHSPRIPVAIDEKGLRLLQYLYRHSAAPGESVLIYPLANHYNLTYSPNLQEFVYIIEKLREEQFIIREGMNFILTEKGRSEAAARAWGRKLKSCFVLVSDNESVRADWSEKVLPKIQQCGYLPRLFQYSGGERNENHAIELISESKLIIADISDLSPEVYFAAGYALSKNIPIVWTVKRNDLEKLNIQTYLIKPIVWDTTEELADMLQQKLSL